MSIFAQQQLIQVSRPASLVGLEREVPRQSQGANPVLRLQRTIGNQAVQQFLQTNVKEPEADSIAISTPGDKYEQEADRIADQVMRVSSPQLQRACLCGGCPRCQTQRVNQGSPLQAKQIQESNVDRNTESPTAHKVLNSTGQSLDSSAKAFFEPRFGHDFSQVRVHTDSKAAESAQAVNALAYTMGHDMFFAPGQFQPHSFQGRRLIAHELTHVLQQTGFRRASNFSSEQNNLELPKVSTLRQPALIQRLTSAHGQHVSGGQADLTADLTSPIVVGSSVRFESRWGYVPTIATDDRIRYYWAIYDRVTNNRVMSTITSEPRAMLHYSREGQFRVEHQLLVGGPRTGSLTEGSRLVGSVSLNQDVVAENSTVAQQSSDVRELVNNFKGYIIDAATSTGSSGITPLFLASVLRMEIENTTPLSIFSTPKYRLSEIADVESEIDRRESGQSFDPDDINRSVGVGQIRLSTAAMLFGDIPWHEQDITQRRVARQQISRDFDALRAGQQRDILTTLRWPRSNINTAAQLLTRLKNRPNRYPAMTRTTFGTNQRAVEIIATEYNGGATTTPEVSAGSNYYGSEIWNFMQNSFMQAQFPNT